MPTLIVTAFAARVRSVEAIVISFGEHSRKFRDLQRVASTPEASPNRAANSPPEALDPGQ
jgi:hypothetical protein